MVQFHIPGYDYCGPGTDLTYQNPPRNYLDAACQDHDRGYNSNLNYVLHSTADEQLAAQAKEQINNPNFYDSLAARLVYGIFKYKSLMPKYAGKRRKQQELLSYTNKTVRTLSDRAEAPTYGYYDVESLRNILAERIRLARTKSTVYTRATDTIVLHSNRKNYRQKAFHFKKSTKWSTRRTTGRRRGRGRRK